MGIVFCTRTVVGDGGCGTRRAYICVCDLLRAHACAYHLSGDLLEDIELNTCRYSFVTPRAPLLGIAITRLCHLVFSRLG